MNLKKEITDRLLKSPSYKTTDNTGAVVGLIAGLAVGAVLGVLFAPDSGKRIREQISDKAMGLSDNMKDSFVALKEQLTAQKENLMGLKDRLVDNVKGKADNITSTEAGRSEPTMASMTDSKTNPVQQI